MFISEPLMNLNSVLKYDIKQNTGILGDEKFI